MTADEEDRYLIGQANDVLRSDGRITDERILVRKKGEVEFVGAPRGAVPRRVAAPDGVGGHRDDSVPRARRRQPRPDGCEHAASGRAAGAQRVAAGRYRYGLRAAVDAGDVIVAELTGVVEEVSADYITVMGDDGTRKTDRLNKFARSNHGTCANQRPIVDEGRRWRPVRCWPTARAPRTARWLWARTCSWRSCRGRVQL